MQKLLSAALSLMVVILTASEWQDAGRELLLIGTDDAIARADVDSTLAQHYTIPLPLPTSIEASDVERVVIELIVDVEARSMDGIVNPTPVLEVYALKEPYSGTLATSDVDLETRATRPVARGRGRRVLLDITDIARPVLDGTSSNYGLVIGSLSGNRDGEFTLVSGGLPGNAVGWVRVYRRMTRN